MSKTFDLSTLNLSAGTHEITVKARASGYADSPASNAVSYVVEGDTVQVSGTYYFNETIVAPTVDIYEEFNFDAADADNYYGIVYNYEPVPIYLYYHNTADYSDLIVAYNFMDNTWSKEGYRTITFDGVQTVSKEFYEWLVANATRPISGTWKFNETIDLDSFSENVGMTDVLFTSQPASETANYTSIVQENESYLIYDDENYDSWIVYRVDTGWADEAFRTITFVDTQYVTPEFYKWFTENAVFAFTIDGTTYYAKEGMTWGEWVESEYNTAGCTIGDELNAGGYYIKGDNGLNLLQPNGNDFVISYQLIENGANYKKGSGSN